MNTKILANPVYAKFLHLPIYPDPEQYLWGRWFIHALLARKTLYCFNQKIAMIS